MIRNKQLEKVHKRLTELLEKNIVGIDDSTLSELVKECNKLGDIIYLPNYTSNVALTITESFLCPICKHFSLRTVLTDKVNKTSLADYGAVYKKTCKDCGHIYYANKAGIECFPENKKHWSDLNE